MFLTGKTALVTGSTSGIGLAIARALAGKGANVVLNGFGDPAEIEKTRGALEAASGAKAIYSDADLTRADAIEVMMAEAAEAFGLPPSSQLKSRETLMVWSRCEKRPFCIPPPKNCSFVPRPRVCVVEVSVQDSGAASDHTSWPFER